MDTHITQKPFRVIIAGGGVAGLTLAHALYRANIDHVVLTRGSSIAPEWGASIGMHPHGSRILHQLGLLEEIEKLCVPMDKGINRLPDGSFLCKSNFFHAMKENNGYHFLLIERRAFLQILYDHLPNRSVVKLNKEVVGFQDNEKGVVVHLSDGTVEEGDIIVGCDGVNSNVRSQMWDIANGKKPGIITATEKRCLQTTYTALIGMAPTIAGLGDRDMTCVHNDRFSFLSLTQPSTTYFFAIAKLPRSIRWPNRARWTQDDAEKEARRFADSPVSDSILFGELWKKRIRGSLVSMEEGILEHWHFGRTVLVGDSVHKVTANIALGGNSAMESAVVLANELNSLVQSTSTSRMVSQVDVESAFSRYQKVQKPRMDRIGKISALVTRLQAWDGVVMKFLCRWIVPLMGDFGDSMLSNDLGNASSEGTVLNFLPIASRQGKMMWKDEVPLLSGKRSWPWLLFPLLLSVIVTFSYSWWGLLPVPMRGLKLEF